jgi:hypothetical protein
MRFRQARLAIGGAMAVAAILLAACGGGSSDSQNLIDIRDRPELEIYDNEHTTAEQIHLLAGQPASYTVLPPYGEEHSPIPLACGIYSSTPAFEMVVHAMEHGAVVLWYTPDQLSGDDVEALTQIASDHLNDSDYVIQAPYGGLGSPLMLVAWGVRLPLDGVDARAIEQFFDEFHDDAPEPLGAGGCATAN